MTDFQLFSNLANTIRSDNTDAFNEQIEQLNNQQLQQVLAMNEEGNNLLHIAIEQGKKDIVEALLKKGIDIKAKNSEKLTALQIASKNGLTDLVELIISYDDIANYTIYKGDGHEHNDSDQSTLNPLILAAQEKHYDTIKLLIQKNFYTNELHYFSKEIINNDNFEEYGELLEFLKNNGYNLKTKDSQGCTALFLLAHNTRWNEGLFQFFVQDKELNLINEPNNKGDTFLYDAFSYRLFKNKDVKDYKKIIDAGADYLITNNYGWTPLHCVLYMRESYQETDFLLPYFFDNTNSFNIVSFFKEALDNGADPSYFRHFYYTAATSLDIDLMKLFINFGKHPYYSNRQEADATIEWFQEHNTYGPQELQMLAFLTSKGMSFLSETILYHLDDLLPILKENKQRECEENNDELENQEFKTLNTPEEQILGIMNLLIALGNGLDEAGNDQELTNDYSVALEKLKDHVESLNLEELGDALMQKRTQAQKETNPKAAYSNVVFFKTLCNSYDELDDMMLKDETIIHPINQSSDAQEVLEKIMPYVKIDAVKQIAQCASVPYLIRHANKDDLKQESQGLAITKESITPFIDIKTQGVLSSACKNPVLQLLNKLDKLGISDHATQEPANKRPILDQEELGGGDSVQNISFGNNTENVIPKILGQESAIESSTNHKF